MRRDVFHRAPTFIQDAKGSGQATWEQAQVIGLDERPIAAFARKPEEVNHQHQPAGSSAGRAAGGTPLLLVASAIGKDVAARAIRT
jgi:hypothetical protein